MSTDFSQKERAFVDGLAAETGRDLDGWMAAIAGAELSHRNDIIDWLRHKGFTFARASWLERIHHNGGKLIYGASEGRAPAQRRVPGPAKPVASGPAPSPQPVRRPPDAPSAQAPPTAAADAEIEALLSAAKAYRPLAQVLLRHVLAAVPGADLKAEGGHIVISHARPFAAILPGPKDVRLMVLCAASPGMGWTKAKATPGLDGTGLPTHMLVLTDARQLTDSLKEIVASCAREA